MERLEPTRTNCIDGICHFKVIAETLLNRFDVKTCYIGQRVKDGKYTRQVVVSCVVKRKIWNLKRSNPKHICKTLSYKFADRQYRIKTDVVSVGKNFVLNSEYNPGDSVHQAAAGSASVGAYALHQDYGGVFITAGHFAIDAGGKRRNVHLKDSESSETILAGSIVDYSFSQSLDYALIQATPTAAKMASNTPITAIYQPSLREDLGKKVFLIAQGRIKPTICRSLYANVDTGSGRGPLLGVILTDPCSIAGDSGGSLVDEHYRLWGILMGVIPGEYSVFMPITYLLANENLIFRST